MAISLVDVGAETRLWLPMSAGWILLCGGMLAGCACQYGATCELPPDLCEKCVISYEYGPKPQRTFEGRGFALPENAGPVPFFVQRGSDDGPIVGQGRATTTGDRCTLEFDPLIAARFECGDAADVRIDTCAEGPTFVFWSNKAEREVMENRSRWRAPPAPCNMRTYRINVVDEEICWGPEVPIVPETRSVILGCPDRCEQITPELARSVTGRPYQELACYRKDAAATD